MSGSDVKTIYRGIIDEVVTMSRPEFVQEGVDEAILDELRVLWEEKLLQSGVLASNPSRIPVAPGGTVPIAPTGANFFQGYYSHPGSARGSQLGQPSFHAPTSAAPWQQNQAGGQFQPQQSSQFPRVGLLTSRGLLAAQGTAGSHQAQMVSGLHLQRPQQGHSAPPQGNVNMSSPNAEALMAYLQQAQGMSSLVGRPQQPAPQLQGQAPQVPLTASQLQQLLLVAQQKGLMPHNTAAYQQQRASTLPSTSQRPAQHQFQQTPAIAPQASALGAEPLGHKRKAETAQTNSHAKQPHLGQSGIQQLDGSTDDKGSGEEDGEKQEADAEEVDKLSDVSSSNEADEDVPNQCLSQFVKVQRTKNRWKCQLLGGVLNLQGRDYVFNQASGEFQF